jgi:hypothetical protein
MAKLIRPITVKFSEKEYEQAKLLSAKLNITMSDLLREAWQEKQNNLAMYKYFDDKITKLEETINEADPKAYIKKFYLSNKEMHQANYKAIKELYERMNKEKFDGKNN